MLTQARASNQYLATQVRSSSPLELVVLLYDAAVRNAVIAKEAMASKDIPTRKAAVSKLMAIVGELKSTLDMERGGAIAQQLDDIYGWALSRLIDATIKRDAAPIEEVRKVLETLRDGWRTIATTNGSVEAVSHP
jgi:flagellar secretion chaperone FliS